jgi:hypothetical protein
LAAKILLEEKKKRLAEQKLVMKQKITEEKKEKVNHRINRLKNKIGDTTPEPPAAPVAPAVAVLPSVPPVAVEKPKPKKKPIKIINKMEDDDDDEEDEEHQGIVIINRLPNKKTSHSYAPAPAAPKKPETVCRFV